MPISPPSQSTLRPLPVCHGQWGQHHFRICDRCLDWRTQRCAWQPVFHERGRWGQQPASPRNGPKGQFLYAAGGALLAFKIDASTGALSQIAGSPFMLAGAQGFRAITVTPSGGFVICAGWSGPLQSSAYVYSLNESTGALTFVGSGSENGISFTSVAVDPTSRFLYVGDNGIGSDDVEAFTIDASTGALTAVSGSPFPAANNPQSLVVAPTGSTLYAGGAGIYEFAIDSSTGALTPIGGHQGSYIFGSSGLFLSQCLQHARRLLAVVPSTSCSSARQPVLQIEFILSAPAQRRAIRATRKSLPAFDTAISKFSCSSS